MHRNKCKYGPKTEFPHRSYLIRPVPTEIGKGGNGVLTFNCFPDKDEIYAAAIGTSLSSLHWRCVINGGWHGVVECRDPCLTSEPPIRDQPDCKREMV